MINSSADAAPAADVLALIVVPTSPWDQELTSRTLRTVTEEFSKTLPDYMVPTSIIFLSDIPTLPSGKTDRKALREIAEDELRRQQQRRAVAMGHAIPRPEDGSHCSSVDALRDIWASILKIQPRSIESHANFFYLGGDSILVMRLVAGARSKSINIAAKDIYDLKTLSAITSLADSRAGAQLSPQKPGAVENPDSRNCHRGYRDIVSSELAMDVNSIKRVNQATDFQAYCLAQLQSKSKG